MATAVKYFNRFELKYVLSPTQQQQVVEELFRYLEPDRHGENQAGYSITSLYFDSTDYKSYWDKIEGHRFRRKLRLRAYGDDLVTEETPIFVEIKQRINKTLQKRRMILPYAMAETFCQTGVLTTKLSPEDQPLADEIQYLTKTLQLRPTCVVAYKRLAFNGTDFDPGLRVTFDTQLKSRVHDLTLLSTKHTENTYFAPPQWSVMEVKVNHQVPYWLTKVIGKHNCVLRRVGKYCTALEEAKIPLYQQRIEVGVGSKK